MSRSVRAIIQCAIRTFTGRPSRSCAASDRRNCASASS
jgi:hypothetical protein